MDTNMLRQRARENLSGNWGLSIAVGALAVLLGGAMAGSSFLPTESVLAEVEALQNLNRFLEEGIRIGNTTFGLRSGILGLAQFLIGGAVQLGLARFLLRQYDGESLSWQELFSQFHRFGQGFAQAFLRNLYIALWSLLLVIPGIVKALSYAMTPYIMAQEPNLTATEAIRKSMAMMDGHKWELFLLYLSFIGWDLLAGLTLGLGHLVLNPYKEAACTAFYRELQQEQPYL